MKIGAYTACLHNLPLTEALALLRDMGLEGAEINAGGFIPSPHLPVADVLAGQSARDDYLGLFDEAGVALTGLNVNGNPLNPVPDVGPVHAADLVQAIELARLLGVTRIVTMSGLPAPHLGGQYPSWVVNPWDSQYLDVLEYQWDEVAVPFWKKIDRLAADADVRICIEMHPQNLVFNPPTLERLVTATGATHLGAELDPSHLFWQGIDPVASIEYLGPLVFHAAAKDTLIIEENCKIYGVLDDRFERTPAHQNPVGLGGKFTLNQWPTNPAWEFVAVGRGHDTGFWARFLTALHSVDPDIAVNIEHEDQSFGQIEGIRFAADNLLAAARQAGLRGSAS
jgi:sugar phosphate isomerase/epimerase